MNFKQSLSTIVFIVIVNAVQAVPYYETVNIGESILQGGSTSSLKWFAPNTSKYKVYVQIPTDSTAVNALYRVYPKGNAANNTDCLSTNKTSPCFEIPINQTLNQGKLVQLMLNKNVMTQWAFSKNVGFISVNADKSASTEVIRASTMRFEVAFPAAGYSKVSNNGTRLPDTAILGTDANAWTCTRDNASGLIWELKTDDGGLRDKDNTYSWYNPNPMTNNGDAGSANGGICTGTIPCDTDAYILAVNAKKLCGYSDWRLPSATELSTLLNRMQIPTINPTYFPNTVSKRFWSSSPYGTSTSNVLVMDFVSGVSTSSSKVWLYINSIRLVRGGQ